jgi:hypothetical protein
VPYLSPPTVIGTQTTAAGTLVYDWSYSWMFTGQRSDVSNETIFDGNVVVFHNRPIGLDPIPASFGAATVNVPAGERVVEAIFAYGTAVSMLLADGTISYTYGYSPNSRSILLRWPANEPDPDVRVGSWIADVTYERSSTEDVARFYSTPSSLTAAMTEYYPGQRCNWYRVTKKTDAEGEVPGTTAAPAQSGYRRMVLTTDTPVKAKTLLQAGGNPYHVNAALVSPYVVNVFPKVFYVR